MMTRIYFTVPGSAEMIRNGRKCTTIRILKPQRREQMERIRKLHLREGSWRSPDQRKIADADLVGIEDILIPLGMYIDQSSDDFVYGEGFDSKDDMRAFFVKKYGPGILQECTFSIIRFKILQEMSE